MAETSDEGLFQRALDGDNASLRTLMERYGDPVVLYVNGYVRDLHTAEDLMMEAFSRLLARRPRLRDGGFRPYLYKTARNLALRHAHDRRRYMSLEDLSGEPEDAASVEEAVLADEDSPRLYGCLSQIPPEYREALFLVYVDGMSYDEAGAVMHKTRKQVDNLVQRGKRAVKELFG